MLKHADSDIQHSLDTLVPPMELNSLGIFRVAVKKFEKQAA